MGYYTQHTMTVRKIRNRGQYENLVKELEDRDLIHYAFDSGSYNDNQHEAYFGCYEEVKWYDHPTDMVAIAEKFPNMYFELEGEGEEFGDFWREYYHDMDIESCRGEIVYEQPKKIQWNSLINF